jgi:hypothetical protein
VLRRIGVLINNDEDTRTRPVFSAPTMTLPPNGMTAGDAEIAILLSEAV